MATRASSHQAGSHRGPPIETAAVLLGVCLLAIYTAMHLAVGGIVHALGSASAAVAVAPDRSMASASASTASSFTGGTGESSTSDALGQASERTDDSRECMPSAAIDSKCIFN